MKFRGEQFTSEGFPGNFQRRNHGKPGKGHEGTKHRFVFPRFVFRGFCIGRSTDQAEPGQLKPGRRFSPNIPEYLNRDITG